MRACPICGASRSRIRYPGQICRRCASRRLGFARVREAGGRSRLGVPGPALSFSDRCAAVAAKVRKFAVAQPAIQEEGHG